MAVSAIIRRARAKLNLRLEVGKASGRLHPIVSVIASLRLADTLRFTPSGGGFSVRCPGIAQADNLAMKAAMESGLPLPDVTIAIDKRIPMQAGLGGGSADAAAALLGLAQISLENGAVVSASTLREVAARVGSDVPSALVPGIKIVAGTGALVTPYQCGAAPPWGILLLKPRAGSDTARAYALLDEANTFSQLADQAFDRARAMCDAFAHCDLEKFLGLLHNDFSAVIGTALPSVNAAKTRLAQVGALRTLLCGSGSCVAGFFATLEDARAARTRIPVSPDEWCAATTFHVA
jgi:4-diphosphocytidyl-2-C-methyl-D-erythritol kinase